MLVYMPQVYVLLTAFKSLRVNAQGCDEGWFGDDCTFKCQCKQSTKCDNGECPNNLCRTGYFGPGCQFENLLKFTTILNNGTPCVYERKFKVNDTVVDVTCENFILFNKLQIKGAVAANICNIYISGGRNVALRQPAQQTSTFSAVAAQQARASNAVDGDTNPRLDDSHCTHTALQSNLPSWSLQYKRKQILYTIRVYNRDVVKFRLRGFILETLNKGGQQIANFTGSSTSDQDVYDIIIASRAPVASLIIRQSSIVPYHHRMLSLCEVETYGDTVCPDRTYGLNCSSKCTCNTTDVCNSITGICVGGCQAGFYGANCSHRCNKNCLYQTCEYLTGNCFQCIPGYVGLQCKTICNPGTFGPGCMHICSEGCSRPCNNSNGQCTCKTVYSGSLCTECIGGRYGGNCSKKCEILCVNTLCDRVTGDCLKCPINHEGRVCEDCVETFFGPSCKKKCPVHCVNRTCYQKTGECIDCEKGFRGLQCEDETSPSLLILAPFLLLLVILIVCYKIVSSAAHEGQ